MSKKNETMMPGVFDFVNAASFTKQDLIRDSYDPETFEKAHEPYVCNKAFSYHQDTILFANEMNERHWLPKDANFRYFLNSLRPRKRYGKWHKTKKSEEIDAISTIYNVNLTIAAQYHSLLTQEQLDSVMAMTFKGGTGK